MGLALTRAAVMLTFAFDASACRSTVSTEMSSGEAVVASPTGLENLLSSSHAGDCGTVFRWVILLAIATRQLRLVGVTGEKCGGCRFALVSLTSGM